MNYADYYFKILSMNYYSDLFVKEFNVNKKINWSTINSN
jgi:hypothetical protein